MDCEILLRAFVRDLSYWTLLINSKISFTFNGLILISHTAIDALAHISECIYVCMYLLIQCMCIVCLSVYLPICSSSGYVMLCKVYLLFHFCFLVIIFYFSFAAFNCCFIFFQFQSYFSANANIMMHFSFWIEAHYKTFEVYSSMDVGMCFLCVFFIIWVDLSFYFIVSYSFFFLFHNHFWKVKIFYLISVIFIIFCF